MAQSTYYPPPYTFLKIPSYPFQLCFLPSLSSTTLFIVSRQQPIIFHANISFPKTFFAAFMHYAQEEWQNVALPFIIRVFFAPRQV